MLIMAVKQGLLPLVQSFLSFGAFVNSRDKDGNTALMVAIIEDKGQDMVRYLVQHGADPERKNSVCSSLFSLHRLASHPQFCVMLIERSNVP
jgi:ankyrin repeat protein